MPDVIDVWIDSSVATWATVGYPGNEADFEALWPADLIVEAHDQTRGWFWSQLGMGTAALDEIPYEEVVMHGFANDSEGRKMSKSLGNIVTPEEAIEEYGRDPLRAYLIRHDQHGADLAFEWDGLGDTESDLNVLWNVFRFPLPYMELDGYDPADPDLEAADLTPVDRWVLSRLQTVETEMAAAWEEYAVHDALSTLLDFVVEDVSRFYVKAVRERMWAEERSPDKVAAYATMATVLDEVVRLVAPFTPYLAERIYQRLDGSERTVHQRSHPTPDDRIQDEQLERRMAVLRAVEGAAAEARQHAGRKLRWPVSRVVVESESDDVRGAVEALSDLLVDRTNARQVEVVPAFDDLDDIAEPVMDEIGPAFGADAERVMDAVGGSTPDDLGDPPTVTVDGEPRELDGSMVEYRSEAPEGIEAAEFTARVHGDRLEGTVYVDATLTEELKSEGYARDVVRRIQEMRKRLDLAVDEEIHTAIDVEDDEVAEFVDEHRDHIAAETRTSEFVDQWGDRDDRASVDDSRFDLREDWEIEGVPVTIGIARTAAEQRPN